MRIFGIIISLLGLALFLYGLREALTVSEIIVAGVTGTFTKATMKYLVGGLITMTSGVSLMYFGREKKRRRWV